MPMLIFSGDDDDDDGRLMPISVQQYCDGMELIDRKYCDDLRELLKDHEVAYDPNYNYITIQLKAMSGMVYYLKGGYIVIAPIDGGWYLDE